MNKITDFFNIVYNNVLPDKGKILVSQPFMPDGCFNRSVILLTEYSQTGAVGFVLNKSLEITMKDVMDDFPSGESFLSIGGPVATRDLHYLHTMNNVPDAIQVMDGIYWGGNIEVIKKLLSLCIMKPENIRFFLGYSGWSGGQLDEELKNNSWLVGDIFTGHIIHPVKNMWQEAVKNMGDEYKVWMTFPETPVLN